MIEKRGSDMMHFREIDSLNDLSYVEMRVRAGDVLRNPEAYENEAGLLATAPRDRLTYYDDGGHPIGKVGKGTGHVAVNCVGIDSKIGAILAGHFREENECLDPMLERSGMDKILGKLRLKLECAVQQFFVLENFVENFVRGSDPICIFLRRLDFEYDPSEGEEGESARMSFHGNYESFHELGLVLRDLADIPDLTPQDELDSLGRIEWLMVLRERLEKYVLDYVCAHLSANCQSRGREVDFAQEVLRECRFEWDFDGNSSAIVMQMVIPLRVIRGVSISDVKVV